jgi:2',3'-cyclic-nucleotide 2'-phosphodiesterase (5'-nucleotidase family)
MGDALSQTPRVAPGDVERLSARAKLILGSMGQLGYAGYVVGERDLALGLPFLQEAATAAKVSLLAANLTDESGKPLFAGHVVTSSGNLTVCAVAITGKVDGVQGVVQTDPVQAAQSELASFGKTTCDVRLLMAHLPLNEIEPLLLAVPGFDLVVSAHQGFQMGAKPIGSSFVLFPGERGRQVLRLKLESAGGQAPFADEGNLALLREDLTGLDRQIDETKKRKHAAAKAMAKAFDQTLDSFEKRRKDLLKKIAEQKGNRASRVFKAELVGLGTDVADDADTLAAVDQHLASYPEPHPVAGLTPPALAPRPLDP